MLGGGIWLTQNKVLPGSYINFVNASKATANLGERGVVAIALPLSGVHAGEVIEVTAIDFIQNHDTVLGANIPDDSEIALQELFKYATKVYVYNTYVGEEGEAVTVGDICKALEPYDFNVIACYTSDADEIATYIAQVKLWRDTYGKKVQGVVYNAADPDYEGIINVVSTVSDGEAHALVAWVAGVEAACAVNASVTNRKYNGSLTVITDKTQGELEECITSGQFAFHLVYGDVRVLEDITSLVTTTVDKGEDFKSNQTIRVCDQIANDIAKLYNTKYVGIIPNDDAGRTSLWGDIVKHHKELETLRAIENFDSSLVVVSQGDTKKSVVITDVINVVNAMSQLYMTVVVQ